MSDFAYLGKLQVRPEATARCVLHNIVNPDGSNPVLLVAPATQANKPLFAAMLKSAQGAAARGSAIDLATVARRRAEDRRLYSQHVVHGWEGVLDGAGQPVPFSAEKCHSFLCALDDWLFDRVTAFCEQPTNFLAEEPLNGAALGKA